jgi:hypothetical protein
MRSGFLRGLAVYLAVALLPTPLLVSWFLTFSSSAAAVDQQQESVDTRPPSLTDLASPQPRLISPASEGPNARLARMQLVPRDLSPEEQVAQFGPHFANATEAREFQLANLTAQLGNPSLALAVIVESEKPLAGTTPLHLPTLDPVLPDPFIRLSPQADYKRANQAPGAD